MATQFKLSYRIWAEQPPRPAPGVPYLSLLLLARWSSAGHGGHAPSPCHGTDKSSDKLTDGRSKGEPLPPMQAGGQTFLLWQLEQR